MNRRETLRAIGAGALFALPVAPAIAVCTAPPAAEPIDMGIPMPTPDPLERARRAWAEFSAAMDAMTLDAHGWMVLGAGHRRPFPGVRTSDSRWLNVVRIELAASPLGTALGEGHKRIRI